MNWCCKRKLNKVNRLYSFSKSAPMYTKSTNQIHRHWALNNRSITVTPEIHLYMYKNVLALLKKSNL